MSTIRRRRHLASNTIWGVASLVPLRNAYECKRVQIYIYFCFDFVGYRKMQHLDKLEFVRGTVRIDVDYMRNF